MPEKTEKRYILAVLAFTDYDHCAYGVTSYRIESTGGSVCLENLAVKENCKHCSFLGNAEADSAINLLTPIVKRHLDKVRETLIFKVPVNGLDHEEAEKQILSLFIAHSKKYHAKTEKWLKD